MEKDDDWNTLLSFFPKNWKKIGIQTGAITRQLRGFKSEEDLMRTFLIHLACGRSLRETVARARESGLTQVSDIALFKRLKASQKWFHEMCLCLISEQNIHLPTTGIKCRLFDATTVSEPGKTGSLWRIHFSIKIPSFSCDFLKISPNRGVKTGESLLRFPIQQDDYIIGDRGYSHAVGIRYVAENKAYSLIRLNPANLPLVDSEGRTIPVLKYLKKIKKTGQTANWKVFVLDPQQKDKPIQGRFCVIRKTKKAIQLAQKKARWTSRRKGHQIQKSTLEYAKYFMVFTTFPEEEFTCKEVLQWYRLRWQIELVFKRFKSIAQLGHLPKHDTESSLAWLYGKLFTVILVQKITNCANSKIPKESWRPKSQWREFSFILHQIQRAIEPTLSLKDTIQFWREISDDLSEPTRKRKYQLDNQNLKKNNESLS